MGSVPGKVNPEKQKEWLAETLNSFVCLQRVGCFFRSTFDLFSTDEGGTEKRRTSFIRSTFVGRKKRRIQIAYTKRPFPDL